MAQTLDGATPMPGDAPSCYDILGVSPHASAEEIAAAYRRRLELYDPVEARALGDEFVAVAEEQRAAAEKAYATLSDPRRRFAYDRRLGLLGDEATDRRGISNREVLFAVGGILAGLLILAGLWSAFGGTSRSGPAVTEVQYAAQPFTLRTLDGGAFNLAEHRGKVVLINFWGTWCEPCKEETPALEAAYRKLAAEGLVIVGVDLFDDERTMGNGEEQVRQFVDGYGVTYPIALDETGDVGRDYKLYNLPVSYFIDRSGNVRFIRIGQLTTADVKALFRRL